MLRYLRAKLFPDTIAGAEFALPLIRPTAGNTSSTSLEGYRRRGRWSAVNQEVEEQNKKEFKQRVRRRI